MRKFLTALLGTTLLTAFSADAITLEDALRAAYESNPEILASRARLAAVDEGYNLAKSQGAATLDLEGFYGASRRKRSTIFSSQTVQEEDVGGELGLSLTKPLYQGGRVKALKQQSKADIEAARQTLRTVQQKVFLETTTAYIDVVFDQEVLKLQQKHKIILSEMENLVTTREEIGVGTETDIWRIKSRASAIEGDITRAETALSVSETVFNQVTGRPAENMNWGRSLSVPQSVEGSLQLARRNNPRLFEALSREDSAKAAIDVAKSAFKPTVALVGNTFITDDSLEDYRDYDLDGVTVGLNLRMPLLSGGATKARVNSAKHQLASRKFETALVERGIKSAVEQSWAQYKGALTVRESIKRRMKNADKTYNNIKIEFELGTRTIFDVVEAEQDYLNSQVEFLQSRRDAEQAAALLLASMGMTDTIPHIQQLPPSGAKQTTSAAYAPLVKSDSPVELKRAIPIQMAAVETLPVHKVIPADKPRIFASQTKSETSSDLGLRLRTRAVPQTMVVPTIRQTQPVMSREQIFASVAKTDSPMTLARRIVFPNQTTKPVIVKPPTIVSATPMMAVRSAPHRPMVSSPTVMRKVVNVPTPSREQVFASLAKSDTPSALGRRIVTAKAPLVTDRATVFAPQTTHDAPADLGRLIRFRAQQPATRPIPVRPIMPVPVQPPQKMGFQYALD